MTVQQGTAATPSGARLQYWGWRLATGIAGRIPARATYAVAWILGSIAYWLWPRGRRAMHRNYRRVLPGAAKPEIRRVARRSLINYCCYLADFIRFPSLSPAEVIGAVHGHQQFSSLDAALEGGNGAVIVCMHFGNWDLGAGATAARGYPATAVAESFGDPRLDAMVVESRTRLGLRLVKMDKSGPSLVRTLHHNGLLALLIDRPVPGDGVKVRFFGSEVEVPNGPARLALRTGAHIVAAAFPRMEPGRMGVGVLTEFIDPAAGGRTPEDVRKLTQAIMDAHERFIRRYPDQWYMFREMWPRMAKRGDGETG